MLLNSVIDYVWGRFCIYEPILHTGGMEVEGTCRCLATHRTPMQILGQRPDGRQHSRGSAVVAVNVFGAATGYVRLQSTISRMLRSGNEMGSARRNKTTFAEQNSALMFPCKIMYRITLEGPGSVKTTQTTICLLHQYTLTEKLHVRRTEDYCNSTNCRKLHIIATAHSIQHVQN